MGMILLGDRVSKRGNCSMSMNPRQLQAFSAVMRAGGISRASRVLHLSQPAVSKLIAGLEGDVGFPLFRRDKKRLSPTAEAHIFLAEVDAILNGMERLRRVSADLKNTRRGHLTIGTIATFGLTLLPEIIASFQKTSPETSVHLHVQTSPKLLDLAHTQQLDIAISMLASDSPAVQTETLMQCRAVCVLPSGHRLAGKDVIVPRDLEGEAFISLGETDRVRQLVDRAFEQENIARKMVTSTQFGMAACEFVRCSNAVTVVAPMTARASVNRDLVIKPFRPEVVLDIKLLRPRMKPPSSVRESFLRHLRDCLERWNLSHP